MLKLVKRVISNIEIKMVKFFKKRLDSSILQSTKRWSEVRIINLVNNEIILQFISIIFIRRNIVSNDNFRLLLSIFGII